MLVEMKVTGLTIDPFTNMPIIILKDMEEKSALPIWIGLIEASSIATELEKIQLSRPMTHDLLKSILDAAHLSVTRVEITDLSDNTFYAHIHIQMGDELLKVESRPSDAIAMALRTTAPIFVDRKVIEKSRQIDLADVDGVKKMAGDSELGSGSDKQKWTEFLEGLNLDDFGKYKM